MRLKFKFRYCNPFQVLVNHETLVRYFSNSLDLFIWLNYVKNRWNIIRGWHWRSRLSFTVGWTRLLTWWVSCLLDPVYVHRKLEQPRATRGQYRDRVCFSFHLMHGRSNKLETCLVLLSLFCLIKDQFWFLLMLRTPAVEACKKKHKNANCSAPKTVTRVTKVNNLRYFTYLHLR